MTTIYKFIQNFKSVIQSSTKKEQVCLPANQLNICMPHCVQEISAVSCHLQLTKQIIAREFQEPAW